MGQHRNSVAVVQHAGSDSELAGVRQQEDKAGLLLHGISTE